MKSYRDFAYVWVCSCATLLSTGVQSAPSAEKIAKKPGDAKTSTTAQVVIPVSTFVIPSAPKEGKDPFFPTSTRLFASKQPEQKGPKQPVPEFPVTLNGISRGLAMVCGRTFQEGEEGEVVVNGSRKKIRCLKIKTESAIIELLPEGERRELKLRFGAN